MRHLGLHVQHNESRPLPTHGLVCGKLSTNKYYFFFLLGPGTCEIRDRRILHGVGEKSPPQCSADGEFLPVQCKFVNTTDMMFFDLVHNYNR